jgi:hypothetical protein
MRPLPLRLDARLRFAWQCSFFRQIRQVGSILLPVLRLLHLAQSGQRADLNRNAEQLALDRVADQLRVAGHALRSLYDIQAAEPGHHRDAATSANHSTIGCRIESPVPRGRQRGIKTVQGLAEAAQVAGVGIGNQVEILGAADIAVCADSNSSDHHEADLVLVERLQQSPEVEFRQRDRARPLIALICLESACTRASRSLIGASRSALWRSARF